MITFIIAIVCFGSVIQCNICVQQHDSHTPNVMVTSAFISGDKNKTKQKIKYNKNTNNNNDNLKFCKRFTATISITILIIPLIYQARVRINCCCVLLRQVAEFLYSYLPRTHCNTLRLLQIFFSYRNYAFFFFSINFFFFFFFWLATIAFVSLRVSVRVSMF